MSLVHGVILTMSDTATQNFKKVYAPILDRPANLRRNINIHNTLIACSLPAELEPSVLDQVKTFPWPDQPIEFQICRIYPASNHYIMGQLDAPQITQLHLQLIESIQPYLAEHFLPKYLDYELKPKQYQYLHTYGYHLVKEFFVPHVSLGKYETSKIRDQEFKQFKQLPINQHSFVFDRIRLDRGTDSQFGNYEQLWTKQLI